MVRWWLQIGNRIVPTAHGRLGCQECFRLIGRRAGRQGNLSNDLPMHALFAIDFRTDAGMIAAAVRIFGPARAVLIEE